jgi:hypothetical protein
MVVGLWAPAGHTEVRPAVVELFTSEGCSSCPPAEAYLGELARRRDVLALAFHVDYWDDLGWRDRFGLPEAARRQRTYAQVLRLASAYTPQVVVDGKYDFVGSDRRAIDKAVAAPRSGVAVGVSLHDGEVLVQLGAADGMPSGDVILVAFRRSSVTAIGRGENAGRTLEEFNMVRDFRSLGHWAGRAQQLHCRLDALPRDATDVAVLIQPGRQAPIIGAGRLSLR